MRKLLAALTISLPVTSTTVFADDPAAPEAVFVADQVGEEGAFEVRGKVADVARGPSRTENGPASFQPLSKRFLKVVDPGENSQLDFASGDTLTIEAWIRIEEAPSAAFPYIVGKGRTHTVEGEKNDSNQNYALRLSGSGKSELSFLWMDETGTEVSQSAHRWTSKASVPVDGRWHHVAMSYTFGTGGEAVGYIDGEKTGGVWDMRGNSDKAPVVDNDDLWVGASTNGNHLFPGLIDGLAIYRGSLSEKLIAERTKWVDTQVPEMPWPADSLPVADGEAKALVADITGRSWFSKSKHDEPAFETDGFAITRLPNRYNDQGLIVDRPGASMVRMATIDTLPEGTCRLLIRSLDGGRVYCDGKLIGKQAPGPVLNGSAHNRLYTLEDPPEGVVQQTAAHSDTVVEFESDGKPHRFEAYRFLGGDRHVHQLGEFLIAVAGPGEPFRVLGSDWQPNDTNWQALLDRENSLVHKWSKAARAAVTGDADRYWQRRHELAATQAGSPVEIPTVQNEGQTFNEVDHFVIAKLEAEDVKPMPLVDDDAFLRRATLDITGRIPTLDELRDLGRDQANAKPLDRKAVIDSLLASDEWADHWTPYWMDVLAENPALTKPTLNNTGPFRWYIHDAMTDNWGMDRFVTHLVTMGGSQTLGGPAGFGMASQNDVPMAAKAHVLGTAFLGVEMKCARCHDAPSHPFQQSDLFSMAAMLNQKPLKVPASSSIPATPEEIEKMVVNVSIKPGEEIRPQWPFPHLADIEAAGGDTREQLAAAITAPSNMRFREVLVNRLWKELIGVGLVESTGDWTDREASHPDLLKYLARELLISGDDMKHVARIIMNSALYQREAVPGVGPMSLDANEFRGPIRRRLTAEQIVDSLHVAVGKPMRGAVQSFGQDGSQSRKTFFEMGRPSRAWQLVCTASERDRNSLRIPSIDMLNELLQAYGWRPQRQEPQDRPDEQPTPLRPVMLANGPTAALLLDASADAWLTKASQKAGSPIDLIHSISLATLGRRATAEEVDRYLPLVEPGFEDRLTGQEDLAKPIYRRLVSWRNHFDPVADELVLNRVAELEAGDGPTKTLEPEWRQGVEDVMWVMVNSPEFSWIP